MKRAILGAVVAAIVFAQAPPANVPPLRQPQSDDPQNQGAAPDHGVARLSFIEGNVSVRQGDAGDLTAGAVNAPLMVTDRVSTGEGSRAEVEFDSLNLIRLGQSTEVRMSELQYKLYQVQIAQGTLMFRVMRDNDAHAEISTPTVLVRPAKAGSYRITVNPDGTTEIGVRSGQAEVFGPNGSEFVNAGQTMRARGSAADPEVQVIPTGLLDEFDRWNAERDRAFDRPASSRYVSPDVAGAESLDQYGRWQNDPQYGNVWVPSVAPGWAPYQDGRWVYSDYYGWTWLGAEPWGWAPYHYGWWYPSPWGWAWWPGAIGPAYYWRPAVVGFFGWGSGFGFGFGFGFGYANVGWVALAPHEYYHPWYGPGYVGVSRTNIVNNVNITNVYRNAGYTNGVTSVRASDFGRGAVNSYTAVRASSADLARAGSVRGAMPFTPSATSRRFSDASVTTRGMPQPRSAIPFSSAGSRVPSATRSGPTGSFANRGFASLPQAAQRTTVSPSTGANGGWRRFDPSTARQPGAVQPRTYAPQPAPQTRSYSAAPSASRYPGGPQAPGGPGGGGFASQQRVHINPPIIHDRGPSASPHPSGGGSRGDSGGGHNGGRR